jgi:hypothetical protein
MGLGMGLESFNRMFLLINGWDTGFLGLIARGVLDMLDLGGFGGFSIYSQSSAPTSPSPSLSNRLSMAMRES